MDWHPSNAASTQGRHQQEREQAYEDSLVEDMGEEFRLPITHRPSENLDLENLEQDSLDTQLSSSNVGFCLLQKMGWKGRGLGKEEQGIVEPIKAGIRDPKLGLGKQEQDDFYTAEENVHRKRLEVEIEETIELTKKREVEAEHEQKIQIEMKEIQKVFYCELCNKQYKSAMEFETHLSSYDHNHKKDGFTTHRFREMRELHANRDRDERAKRELARQEKQMEKFVQQAEAQRQQQAEAQRQQTEQQQQQQTVVSSAAAPVHAPVQDKRSGLKFGFTSKTIATKMPTGTVTKKMKVVAKVANVFKEDSDNEQ